MRSSQFLPTLDGEARLLLLIDEFSGKKRGKALEGRTKLAKLDFFVRYPTYLKAALHIRHLDVSLPDDVAQENNLDTRMVRYRYGPWDPTYFAVIGRLIGKGLVEPVPTKKGIGYRATESGRTIANHLRSEAVWKPTADRAQLLRKHLDWNGEKLKQFIYDNFQEITGAPWGTRL